VLQSSIQLAGHAGFGGELTMNSWGALHPKLAPNPEQHKAGPILLGAIVATAAGVALTFGNLTVLFGVTGVPTTFAHLREGPTWRLILEVACLYVMWSVIWNGNNFFGLYRPAGYTWCFIGAFGFVVVARDLIITVVRLEVTTVVLHDPLGIATISGSILLGALLLRTGNVRFARARRYLAQVVREPADLHGLGYSLYLRTFGQDDALSRPPSFVRPKQFLRSLFVVEETEELQVVDALANDDAPMVGVGRPGEPAPHVGALRVYLPNANWKPQVRELIEGARHVVLALGWGEGTLWELRETMHVLAPEQLILVVPMEQAEYERFRRETAKSLPAGLPAYAGRHEIRSAIHGLVTFSEGWQATFVPLRAYSPIHNSLNIAVLFAAWPALRRLGYPPRGVLRWAPNAI
jgi:hypothetical protein